MLNLLVFLSKPQKIYFSFSQHKNRIFCEVPTTSAICNDTKSSTKIGDHFCITVHIPSSAFALFQFMVYSMVFCPFSWMRARFELNVNFPFIQMFFWKIVRFEMACLCLLPRYDTRLSAFFVYLREGIMQRTSILSKDLVGKLPHFSEFIFDTNSF
jgi:hypothetical protein